MDEIQLDLRLDESGNILNAVQLLELIREMQYDFNLAEQLETFYQNLTTNNYGNKTELEAEVAKKLIEFNAYKSGEKDNASALAILQANNEDLRKLRYISTRREDNDSRKYSDYVEIVHDNGEVERIECNDPEILNDFIQKHSGEMTQWTAEEVFGYFKKYISEEVEMHSLEEHEKDEKLAEHAVMQDETILYQEEEAMIQYAKQINSGDASHVAMTVDSKGERLWTTNGRDLFKFIDNGNSIDLVQISAGDYERQVATPEEQAPTAEQVEQTQREQLEAAGQREVVDTLSKSDLSKGNNDDFSVADIRDFDLTRFKELMEMREIYESTFNDMIEERNELYGLQNIALEQLKVKVEEGELDEELFEAVSSFLAPIIEEMHYDPQSTSKTDMQMIEKYEEMLPKYQELQRIEERKKQREKENGMGPKQYVLKMDPRHGNNHGGQRGVANLIILLELGLIGGIIISLIALVMS